MKRILPVLLFGLGFSVAAHAVPWCHRGHIVTVDDVTWSETELLDWAANNPPPPPGNANPDAYIAGHASWEHCQAYAGWNGPTFGVPGAGSVGAFAYAPYSYTSTLYYEIDDGLQFECRKCMPILELQPVRRPFELSP